MLNDNNNKPCTYSDMYIVMDEVSSLIKVVK